MMVACDRGWCAAQLVDVVLLLHGPWLWLLPQRVQPALLPPCDCASACHCDRGGRVPPLVTALLQRHPARCLC
jgi:hypothetical protein